MSAAAGAAGAATSTSFNAVASAYGPRWTQTLELLQMFGPRALEVSAVTISVAVSSCANGRAWQAAAAAATVANTAVFNAVLNGACSAPEHLHHGRRAPRAWCRVLKMSPAINTGN
eukprot:g27686.t1